MSQTPSTPLGALADAYWEAYLESNPLHASALGERRFDDRMPDPTPDGVAKMRARTAALLERLGGVSETGLDDAERVTRSALHEALASDLDAVDAGLDEWTVDPLEGVPVGLLNVPDYQRLETPEDGRRMVARWQAMAVYADAHLAGLRRSLAGGRVACRAPVERNVDILDELLARRTADWPLLRPLGEVDNAEGWTTADRERFRSALIEAVELGVRPAFTRLRAGLADEMLPAARTVDRPGIGHLDGGAEAYRRLIRVHTSLDLEPEAVHATGLAEIERIDAELEELAGRTIGASSRREAIERLRADPALHFATADEVHAKAVDSLARAAAAIPSWFGRLPQAPCRVVRMAPHEEEHSTIAYYREPAIDGSRPGQYYVNTSHPETRPRYEAEVLAYHESIPGHHLQLAIAQELPGLPAFRRHLGPTAFIEGWGLYTERLADEMGLYTGDLDRIGVLSFDGWRAARLVVDTGMHALGWSRDRAITFMLEHTALAPNNIENEVDRYIVWPGQALAYKTGQLELLRLRAEAREALAAAFDIRTFHDAVLENGALPLSSLGQLVRAWSDGRRPS